MGATTFVTEARGETAQKAFTAAVQDACYEHGNGGYTGTIAEKNEFVMIPLPPGYSDNPSVYAHELIDAGDPRIDNKWGPAGCLELGLGHFLFFGWASE